jgi:hypothetical protein
MKKIAILPILLLFAVLVSSCSKKKEEFDNTDKSAEVSQTYQGELKLGADMTTYNNVKVKVTRKGTHQVTLEPVTGQDYPAFTPINYSNFIYSSMSNAYGSSNPSSIVFTFTSDGTINLILGHDIASTTIFFNGTSVK